MRTPDDFFAIELRMGTVGVAATSPESRKPAIKLEIDVGDADGRRAAGRGAERRDVSMC